MAMEHLQDDGKLYELRNVSRDVVAVDPRAHRKPCLRHCEEHLAAMLIAVDGLTTIASMSVLLVNRRGSCDGALAWSLS
ncbi:hypothetical protein [Sphaerimonospora mesophila]|uniref:hypothetical protein n=1 Tax=Sphaerimonospora mesophila TaxID=37483 RepID=UPI0006E39731